MYWVAFIFAFVITISADQDTKLLSKDIFAYFDNELVSYIRKEWEGYREAMENSITLTLQETVGSPGLNVFPAKMPSLRLADAYYHNHGQVQIIFSDMNLIDLPKCWLPQVSFSLASNVLKFEVPLTKMVITADYNVMRNKSDLVKNVNEQDYLKISPFLFYQVPSLGKAAFSVDGCILSGYVMTSLKGESINLGHDKISLNKCRYTMELDSSGRPPVISEFSAVKTLVSLEIKHLLLKPIREDFLIKLQGAIFSVINTTVIFGERLPAVRKAQENITNKCAHGLNKIIRGLNQEVMKINNDVANIDDFFVSWDDNYNNGVEKILLSNMVLTGLGTAYNFHSGGPYKMDKVIIGERIGFSTLQVRGIVSFLSEEEDDYKFSVEISDFAINVDIGVKDMGKYTEGELVGFRHVEFAMPGIINKPVAKFITGYLINEVPRIVIKTMTVDLNSQLMHSEESLETKSNRTTTLASKLKKEWHKYDDETTLPWLCVGDGCERRNNDNTILTTL